MEKFSGIENPYFEIPALIHMTFEIKVLAPEKRHSKQFTAPIV